MFSVPIFIAVACVLPMSDTNQAKTDVSQSRQVTNLEAAMVENENAIRVLDYLISKDLPLEALAYGLSLAQKNLKELRDNTTTNRHASLVNALTYERFGFFAHGECTNYSECNDTSRYVQHGTANIVGLVLEELTDKKKIEKIKKVINGTITENGNLVEGASAQQTQKVATEVLGYIY